MTIFQTFQKAAEEGPAVPDNYEDLLLEYQNLRSLLIRANEKWMQAHEEVYLAKVQVKALQESTRKLKEAILNFKAAVQPELEKS